MWSFKKKARMYVRRKQVTCHLHGLTGAEGKDTWSPQEGGLGCPSFPRLGKDRDLPVLHPTPAAARPGRSSLHRDGSGEGSQLV